MTELKKEMAALTFMVRGAYDLQMLRMQMGQRLCANFRSRLQGFENEPVEDEDTGELSAAALGIIERLRAEYKTLTEGVARNRTIPTERGFTGTPLISEYSELVLIDQYMQIEAQEARQFRQLTGTLEKLPIYTEYLQHQVGIGPAMAAVLVTYLDPHKAHHVSGFWRYAGLDVGPDNRGRSRRQEHLIERTYINARGVETVRRSLTYNPFLKTKLMGVMASGFLRANSPWRAQYDAYKHRLQTDPARNHISVAEWKKLNEKGEVTVAHWTPGRVHRAALRYMVKMFLIDLWTTWRRLEGLPVTPTYHEGKLGHVHGGGAQAAE